MTIVEFPPEQPRHTPVVQSRRGPEAVIALADDYWRLAQRVAATEFVPKDLRGRPEAVVAALLSGAERGLGPMESLRSINVIEGKPSLSAQAMRALVLAAGHELNIDHSDAQKCTVSGRRAGSHHTTTFTWTMDRARRARLANKDNWQRYPESMLLARATTELCNAVFPDVTAGLVATEELQDELAIDAEASKTVRRQIKSAAGPHEAAESGRFAGSSPAPLPRGATTAPTSPSGEPNATGAPTSAPQAPRPPDANVTPDLGGIPGADTPSWGSSEAPPTPEAAKPADATLARKIHRMVADAFPGVITATRDRWRHALCAVVTRKRDDGPVISSGALDLDEQMQLSTILTDVRAGRATVADGPDGIELRAGDWLYTVTLDPPAVRVASTTVLDATSTEPEPADT